MQIGRIALMFAGIVIAVVSLVLDWRGGGRTPRVRHAALVVTALACAAAQFIVAPRIETVRREISEPIEQLSPTDARRVAFGRLHAVSVAWLGLAMLSAGTVIVLSSLSPRTNAPRTSP